MDGATASGAAQERVTRAAVPADYDAIAAVMDSWWGRPVLPSLPRVFLDHFHRTSFVVSDRAGLAAFLVGILSPSGPDAACIHFVGVRPDLRAAGLARSLYERFFALARADGRVTVGAITSPVNETSIAFHRRMGFTVTGPVTDYNGPDTAMVVFSRVL